MIDLLDACTANGDFGKVVIRLTFNEPIVNHKEDYSAVYFIYFNHHARFYIGSTTRIKARLNQHRTFLRKGNHINSELQVLYNNVKENEISFFIFPQSNIMDAKKREQELLDTHHGHQCCLNVSNDAYCSTRGYNREHVYEKLRLLNRTDKYKKIRSENSKNMWRDPEKRKALIGAMGENVNVDGETYGSVREASRETGFSIAALRRALDRGVVDTKKIRVPKRRVSAEGTIFDSITAASKQYGIKDNTMHWRVNNPNWVDYFYVD